MNMRFVKNAIKGIISYLPGVGSVILTRHGTGGTVSARYCYSVWLRHIVMAASSGLKIPPPAIAELGPGDSIGIGLAALISGSDEYYALDVVEYANKNKNSEIFEEIVELFKKREDIPGEAEFPEVMPRLESYEFPDHVLSEEVLKKALDPGRIDAIRNLVLRGAVDAESPIKIFYNAPWYKDDCIVEESVDMIYSQAVLEHVEDLAGAYKAMAWWLKPKGFLSHEIDFSCHGLADTWNGHWAYGNAAWFIIKGARPYLLNRMPHSAHIKLLTETGFVPVQDIRTVDAGGLKKECLAPEFSNISDEDLVTRNAFIQAVKGPTITVDRPA